MTLRSRCLTLVGALVFLLGCSAVHARRVALVIGNERAGLEPEVLDKLDRVAEIPLAGLPHSLNAATSASIAIYEYCRQFPAQAPS